MAVGTAHETSVAAEGGAGMARLNRRRNRRSRRWLRCSGAVVTRGGAICSGAMVTGGGAVCSGAMATGVAPEVETPEPHDPIPPVLMAVAPLPLLRPTMPAAARSCSLSGDRASSSQRSGRGRYRDKLDDDEVPVDQLPRLGHLLSVIWQRSGSARAVCPAILSIGCDSVVISGTKVGGRVLVLTLCH